MITIYRHPWLIEHPDAPTCVELAEWSFAPREPSEWVNPRTGCLHRRFASIPIEVTAPALSRVERGRLSVPWDREHGFPAELVFLAAKGGRCGFRMGKKTAPGPTLFDLDGADAETRTNGPHGPRPSRSIAAPSSAPLEHVSAAAAVPAGRILNARGTGYDDELARVLEALPERPASPRTAETSTDAEERFRDLAETVLRVMPMFDARKFANAQAHLRTAIERLGITGEPS
jgi:hypothetical protein